MSSPVQLPFKNIIQIDRALDRSVYLQIAHQMINAIQRGLLVDGVQLPGTRGLAQELGVHRKTVIAAYDELDAQGWTLVHPNKGTFVRNRTGAGAPGPAVDFSGSPAAGYDPLLLTRYPAEPGYHFRQSSLLDASTVHPAAALEFNDGLPDIRLLPLERLSRIYGGILKSKTNYRHFGYSHVEGNAYYRERLAQFLNHTCGLHINKNNILTTRGIHMSIYMASSVLIEPGDAVIVGELSYYLANMCFQQCGGKLLSVPVDQEGISAAAVAALCKTRKIRMLYLTPHHHYPTTVTLSAERRVALLQLASQYGFIILEDDYDYDFHYNGNPVLPLASADTSGMVVYIGSFCKSLAPGFRSGYLVAPERLIAEMAKFRRLVDRQGDMLMEQAMAELLDEREVQRHLKKAVKIYQERRDVFTGLLESQLSDQVTFISPPGGLSVWTRWNPDLNLMRISKSCARKGLYLPQELLYQTGKYTAMRLGFGNLSATELSEAVRVLTESVKDNLS